MSTISELMEGKKPGEIKIRQNEWDPEQWFCPYYNAKLEWWWGTRESGKSDTFKSRGGGNYWELWEAPKRKKKVAPYILKWNGGYHVMTTYLYANDDEVRHSYKDIDFIEVVQRITALEVEVDE